MERNELAIREALATTGRELALVNSKLPQLVSESRAIERRMWELETQSLGEKIVRFFLRMLRLDGKHRELQALQARHQRLREAIDLYQRQQLFLELEYRALLRRFQVKADLARVADEALRDIENQEIRDSLKGEFLRALCELG